MVEIHTSQPPKNQMKTIFPKQEEIKVKRGYERGENTSHLPKRLSQMFAKEHHTDFKRYFKNTKAVWWFRYRGLIVNFNAI